MVANSLGIDLKQYFGSADGGELVPYQKFSITVEKNYSLYTLLVDNIGDGWALSDNGLAKVLPNLGTQFRKMATGV